MRIRFPAFPTVNASIFRFRKGSDSGNLISARLLTDGTVDLQNNIGGVPIGSPSSALATDAWHTIEVAIQINSGVSTDDYAELRVNGVSVASASNLSLTGSTNTPGQLLWGWIFGPGANRVLYVDNVALNDSTGTADASWPDWPRFTAGRRVFVPRPTPFRRIG